ncbi:MAG: hypothetical protein LBT59_30830 [Clostridiales bacterium]|nr:hypothetical protein [Clostridiales bacterium]
MARYYLMNGNARIVAFEHELNVLGNTYQVISIINPSLMPIELQSFSVNSAYIEDWIERRVIPENRHHRKAVLSAINVQNHFDVLCYSHGMSLNDTFWIQEESENLDYDKINLYDNPFDEALGWIAFTGVPGDISRYLPTPETTTEGMLPKYWRRASSGIVLCKGGTSGYSNAGLEPFAEALAYLIAKRIGVNAIPYCLELRNERPASISSLFTTKEQGLLAASRYFRFKLPGITRVSLSMAIENLKNDFGDISPFYEMCFLDFLIENYDRHLNNWGFLIENSTQKIIGFAPVWDNGMALDYERPEDMRARFDFASFNMPYDFLATCPVRRVLAEKAKSLIIAIRDESLLLECMKAVNGFPRYEARVKPTLEFVESRCQSFIARAQE